MASDLTNRVKLEFLLNGNGLFENFKNNSLHFLDLYNKTTDKFKQIPVAKITPGSFYFFHYRDKSNWMKYAPVFFTEHRKFEGKIILICVNLNFIPLQIRELFFSKFMLEKDFVEDRPLKVDYEGVYNELRSIGFEYSMMEFDASRLELVHRVSMSLVPRFLYHQHPINKYDPGKLLEIWNAKIENREKRHQEMMTALISDFYDMSSEILEKYDSLKNHIKRIRAHYK
jgi:hypothetical protein